MSGKLIVMDDVEWGEADDAIFNTAMALQRNFELEMQLAGDDCEEVSVSGQKLSEDDLVLLGEHRLLQSRRESIKKCVERTKSFREDMESKLQNGILSLVAKEAKDGREVRENEEAYRVVVKTAEHTLNLVKLIMTSSTTLPLRDQQRILMEFARPSTLKGVRDALVDRRGSLKLIDEWERERSIEKCLKEMEEQIQMSNEAKMRALTVNHPQTVQPKQVQQNPVKIQTFPARKRQMTHAPPSMQSTRNEVNRNNNGSAHTVEDVEMESAAEGEMDPSMVQTGKEKADEVGGEEPKETPVHGRARGKSAAAAKSITKEKPATTGRGRGAAKVFKTPTISKTPVTKMTTRGRKGKKEVETNIETEGERDTGEKEGDQTPAATTKMTGGAAQSRNRTPSTGSRKYVSAAVVQVEDVAADASAASDASTSNDAAIPTTTPKGRKPRAKMQHYVEVQVSEMKKTFVQELKEVEAEAKQAAKKEMKEAKSGKTPRRSTRRSGK